MDAIEQEDKNYRARDDPNGAIGHNLADKLIRKYGSIENIPDLSLKGDISKAQKILSEYTTIKVHRSTKQRQLLKGILGRLKREAKAEIKNYNKMETIPMLNYYMSLRRQYNLIS